MGNMLRKNYSTFSVGDLKKEPPRVESEWNSFSVPPISRHKAQQLKSECNKKELIKSLLK